MASDNRPLTRSALERRLLRTYLALRTAQDGATSELAWLLWYLEADVQARNAFAEVGGPESLLPLILLSGVEPDALLTEVVPRLSDLEPGPRRVLGRAIFLLLWLHHDRPDLADRYALQVLAIDPGIEVFPVTTALYEGLETLAGSLEKAWTDALSNGEWQIARRVLILAALAHIDLPVRAPARGAPIDLLLWLVDARPRDAGSSGGELAAWLGEALIQATEGLGNDGETTALRVAAGDLLERHDPGRASAHFKRIANAGADQLAAYLRLRAERAAVVARNWESAAESAASRAELAQEPGVVIATSLLSVLYGLRAQRSLEELEQQARQLLRASRDHSGQVEPELGEAKWVYLGLAESLSASKGALTRLRGLYAELEAAGDTLLEERGLERAMLADELPSEGLEQLLRDTGQRSPWLLPLGFALVRDRISARDLLQVMSSWSDGPYSGAAAVLTDFLAHRFGSEGNNALIDAGPPLKDVAIILAGGPEDEERLELLAKLGARPERQLGGLAWLLLATDAMSLGEKASAADNLVQAGALLHSSAEVEALAEQLERLSGDSGLRERVLAKVSRRRLNLRLEAEPLMQAAWNDAERLYDEGHWSDAVARLGHAGAEAQDLWLGSQMLGKAARWALERKEGLEQALEMTRRGTSRAPENLHLLALHARLLGKTASYQELQQLVRAREDVLPSVWGDTQTTGLLEGWSSETEVDEEELDQLEEVVTSLLDLAIEMSSRSRLTSFAADLLISRGELDRLDSLLDEQESHGVPADEVERVRSRVAARKQAGPEFVAAIEDPARREQAVSDVIEAAAEAGEWEALIERLVAAAEGTTDLAARADVRVVAATIMVNRGAVGPGRKLVADVEPALLGDDGLTALVELLETIEEWDQLAKALQLTVERAPDSQMRSRQRLRLARIQRDHLQRSAKALQLELAAFQDTPTDSDLFARLESELARAGEHNELHALYEVALKALHENPGASYDPETLYARRGELEFYELEQPEVAAESFLSALAENPHEDRYLGLLEAVAEELERPSLVLEALDARIAALPDEDPSMVEALLERAASTEDPAEKRQILERALDLSANREDIAVRLMKLYEESNDPAPLAALYEKRMETAGSDDMPRLARELAILQEKAGNLEAAAEAWTRVLETSSDMSEPLERLEAIHGQTGDGASLLSTLHQALGTASSNDDRAEILRRLGAVYRDHLGDLAQAQHSLQRSLAIKPAPETLDALRDVLETRRDWAKLTEVLEQIDATATSIEQRVSALSELAEVSMTRLGDFAAAERSLMQAIALSPDDVELKGTLLGLLIAAREWSRAAALADTLEGDPAAAAALGTPNFEWMLGSVARAQGKKEPGIGHFIAALKSDPTHRGALAGLLAMEPELGSEGDVFLGELEHLLASVGGRANAVAEIARYRSHRLASSGRVDEALEETTRAQEAAPLRADVFQTRCDLLEKVGRYDEAVLLAEQTANQSRPGSRTWRRAAARAGRIYLDLLRDIDAGRRWFERMRKELPGDLEVLFWLAQACMAAGDPDAAYLHLKRVVGAYAGAQPSQMPDRTRRAAAEHYFYLGQVLESLSRTEEAAEMFARSRSFWREYTPAILGLVRNYWKREAWSQLDTEVARATTDLERVNDTDALLRLRRLEASAKAEHDPVRAIKALEAAIAQAPDSPERPAARAQLARILVERGRDAQALRVTRAGLLESPLEPELLEGALTHAASRHRWDMAQRIVEAVEHFGIELHDAGLQARDQIQQTVGRREPGWPEEPERFLPLELRRGTGLAFRLLQSELQPETRAAFEPLKGDVAAAEQQQAISERVDAIRDASGARFDLRLLSGPLASRLELAPPGASSQVEVRAEELDLAVVLVVRQVAALALGLAPLLSLPLEVVAEWTGWLYDLTPSIIPEPPRELNVADPAQLSEALGDVDSDADPVEDSESLMQAAVEAVDRLAVEAIGVSPTLNWLAHSLQRESHARDALWASEDDRVRRLLAFHLGRR